METSRTHIASAAARTAGRGAPRARRGKPPATLSALVYSQLRHVIVSLQLAPGAPISEGGICKRFNASRTPVRAALLRLQREGFLVLSHAGSTPRLIVAPLTAADMRQLFLMVGALDGVAARLAAQLPPRARLPLSAALADLNKDLRALAACDDPADPQRAEEIDHRFHSAYEAAAGAPEVLRELESLHERRSRYVQVYTQALVHSRNLRESVAEHDAIVAAIEAGDPDLAEQRASFNHRNALERFGRALAVAGERGTWF